MEMVLCVPGQSLISPSQKRKPDSDMNKILATTVSVLLASLLGGCANRGVDVTPQVAFVVMGPEGAAWARAITTSRVCPIIVVDDVSHAMSVRAAAATVALRPTASAPEESKPSAFPVLTCEWRLPPGAAAANIGILALPVPKASPQRVVVYGDSGCRMKRADNAWQACNDPNYWPFEKISRLAAAFKPDLVIHVGDYHYRENACAAAFPGCKDSVWGYGWDAWDADLFKPAATLLAAAPWVMLRGNHEECRRAGQGYYRFLDPRPLTREQSCDEAQFDLQADYSAPYAVPVGKDAQLIVFDTARASNGPLNPAEPKDAYAYQQYLKGFTTVGQLAAKPGVASLFLSHHPLLAFGPAHKPNAVNGGSGALISVAKVLQPVRYYPPGIDFAIHGHIHLLEAINYRSDHPAAMVAGIGGDNLEDPLPEQFPVGASPAEGVVLDTIVHTDRFGFVVMDRDGRDWNIVAYDQNAVPMTKCRLTGSKIHCDKSGMLK